MIVLSFNCHGFASTRKKIALTSLFLNYGLYGIILQETLGSSEEVQNSLSKIMSGWPFLTSDAKGRSGGLALGVKDSSVKLLN